MKAVLLQKILTELELISDEYNPLSLITIDAIGEDYLILTDDSGQRWRAVIDAENKITFQEICS